MHDFRTAAAVSATIRRSVVLSVLLSVVLCSCCAASSLCVPQLHKTDDLGRGSTCSPEHCTAGDALSSDVLTGTQFAIECTRSNTACPMRRLRRFAITCQAPASDPSPHHIPATQHPTPTTSQPTTTATQQATPTTSQPTTTATQTALPPPPTLPWEPDYPFPPPQPPSPPPQPPQPPYEHSFNGEESSGYEESSTEGSEESSVGGEESSIGGEESSVGGEESSAEDSSTQPYIGGSDESSGSQNLSLPPPYAPVSVPPLEPPPQSPLHPPSTPPQPPLPQPSTPPQPPPPPRTLDQSPPSPPTVTNYPPGVGGAGSATRESGSDSGSGSGNRVLVPVVAAVVGGGAGALGLALLTVWLRSRRRGGTLLAGVPPPSWDLESAAGGLTSRRHDALHQGSSSDGVASTYGATSSKHMLTTPAPTPTTPILAAIQGAMSGATSWGPVGGVLPGHWPVPAADSSAAEEQSHTGVGSSERGDVSTVGLAGVLHGSGTAEAAAGESGHTDAGGGVTVGARGAGSGDAPPPASQGVSEPSGSSSASQPVGGAGGSGSSERGLSLVSEGSSLAQPARLMQGRSEELMLNKTLAFQEHVLLTLLIPWTDLKLSKVLGEGGFGKVYKARWQGTVDVAVKMLSHDRMSDAARESLRQEALVMTEIRHPFIAPVFGMVDDGVHHAMVMKYYKRGTVAGAIARVGYAELGLVHRLRMALQVATGMCRLHERQPAPIIHGDLKTSNLLIEDDERSVVIADFGLAKVLRNGTPGQVIESGALTISISPPEVLQNPRAPRTRAGDVYAFGIVLLEIVAGYAAYRHMRAAEVVNLVKQGRRPLIPPATPPDIASLIAHCWHQDPMQRPSFAQVVPLLVAAVDRQAADRTLGVTTAEHTGDMTHTDTTTTGLTDWH